MRINTQNGLPAAHSTAQAGIAPIIILILALAIVAAGGYALKKGIQKKVEVRAEAAEHLAPLSAASAGNTAIEQPAMVTEALPTEMRVVYTAAGFAPKTVTIKKGDTVVFQNRTGKPASVASAVHPTHLLYPEFDQYKTEQRGKDEFRFTFTKTGTWKYHDHLNASMTGTVTVTE